MASVVLANPLLLDAARRHTADGTKLPESVSFGGFPQPDLSALAAVQEAAGHRPHDPLVNAGYAAFVEETRKQFLLLAEAVEIEPWRHPAVAQPYQNSNELFADLRRWHLYFYTPVDMPADHPLAANSGIDLDGFRLTHNHVFRCVHDAFGHGLYSRPFGPTGEPQAWHVHAQMYSPAAVPAMTSETLTQAAWHFGGPYRDIDIKTRPFAPQKAFLTPDEHCRLSPLQAAKLSRPTTEGC